VRPPATGDASTGGTGRPEVLEQLHRAETEVGLVLLVFGTRSDAANQARRVRALLRDAELAIKDASPKDLRAKPRVVQDTADEAETALERFMDSALNVLEA
jgi:hypothetical protein